MRPASLGIIFDTNARELLLIQRCDVPVWVLPGGGIEAGESPEEAAIREVEEETGLRVSIRRKTGEYTPINRLATLSHVFECRIEEGTPLIGEETKSIAFWPLNALPAELFIVHRDWLQDALSDPNRVWKKPITRVTYWAILSYAFSHPLILLRYIWTRWTKK